MNILRCVVVGCTTRFNTKDNVLANARFICRHHTRQEQIEAAGRTFDSVKDLSDTKIRFQSTVNQDHLEGGVSPVGFMRGYISTKEVDQVIVERRARQSIVGKENAVKNKVKVTDRRSKKAAIRIAEEALEGVGEEYRNAVLSVVRADDRAHIKRVATPFRTDFI